MKKQNLILILILGLFCFCTQSLNKGDETTTGIENNDTLTTISKFPISKQYSVVRGRYEGKDYSVIVKSLYNLHSSLINDSSFYCQANFLYFLNQTNKVMDSIELVEGCQRGIIIQDVTSKLKFENPVFNISSPSGSDYYTNEFIELKNNTFKKLFQISEFDKPVDLKRTDENILKGFIKDRDELVYDFQDYPITISLDNYEIKVEKPLQQHIGFTTEVLEDFIGYRSVDNSKKKEYLIKEGTRIIIDSLNRSSNSVRVIISDTIIIHVPFNNIKNKIQVNTAG